MAESWLNDGARPKWDKANGGVSGRERDGTPDKGYFKSSEPMLLMTRAYRADVRSSARLRREEEWLEKREETLHSRAIGRPVDRRPLGLSHPNRTDAKGRDRVANAYLSWQFA